MHNTRLTNEMGLAQRRKSAKLSWPRSAIMTPIGFPTAVALEPTLVAQLKRALAAMEERSVPSHLIDASDWIGQSESARGKALRGLLRTASRIVRSRGPVRQAPPEPFPRFSSET